jgi:ribosome-associated protein
VSPRVAGRGRGRGRRPGPRPVGIAGEGIRLGQLLKLADLVDSGAEAKDVIAAGDVRVNGEPETRRGRQLRHGDVVERAGVPPVVISADG